MISIKVRPELHANPTVHPHVEEPHAGEHSGTIAASPASVMPPEALGFPTAPPQGNFGSRHALGSQLPNGSQKSAVGSPPTASGGKSRSVETATDGSLSLKASQELLASKGLSFSMPSFLEEEPPMPDGLKELSRVPASVDDIPSTFPELRETLEAYAKNKKTWQAQHQGFQELMDKYTKVVAKMISDGKPMIDVTKTWLKLGAVLEGEYKVILLNRHPEKEALTKLLFIDNNHFLNKKDFHLFPVGLSNGKLAFTLRYLNPKDARTIKELRQLHKEMESQLRSAMKDPAATLDSMRDLNTKLQAQLQTFFDRAVLDKNNRLAWHQRWRTNLSWLGTGVVGISATIYAVERFAAMTLESKRASNDDDSSKKPT